MKWLLSTMARGIYDILAGHALFRGSLINAAIRKLETGTSFDACYFVVKNILPTFGTLDKAEVEKIQECYRKNDQMHNYFYTRRDLPNVVSRLTGKQYRVQKYDLIEDVPYGDPYNIPF